MTPNHERLTKHHYKEMKLNAKIAEEKLILMNAARHMLSTMRGMFTNQPPQIQSQISKTRNALSVLQKDYNTYVKARKQHYAQFMRHKKLWVAEPQ